MMENTPNPTPPDSVEPADALATAPNPWTPNAARKAWSAGVAGLIVAVGGAAGPVLSDGAVSGPEAATLAGAAVVGFVGAFFAAWLPTNR